MEQRLEDLNHVFDRVIEVLKAKEKLQRAKDTADWGWRGGYHEESDVECALALLAGALDIYLERRQTNTAD